MKSARDALIYERIREFFDYEENYAEEFLQAHVDRGAKSPYVDCPDGPCKHARKYADDVLTRLEAHGYHPVRRDGPVLYVSPEGWDQLMEDLDAPPKVNEKLRALMDARRPAKSARQTIWDTIHEGDELTWPADKTADNVMWRLDEAGYEIKEKP